MKWYTSVTIVDVETGEILRKDEYERRRLIIIQKTIKNEYKEYRNDKGITEKYGQKNITWECRENPQKQLFD